jgi:hypothetical protein
MNIQNAAFGKRAKKLGEQLEFNYDEVNRMRKKLGLKPLPRELVLVGHQKQDTTDISSPYIDIVLTQQHLHDIGTSVYAMTVYHKMELFEFLEINHLDLLDVLYATQRVKVRNPNIAKDIEQAPQEGEETTDTLVGMHQVVDMFIERNGGVESDQVMKTQLHTLIRRGTLPDMQQYPHQVTKMEQTSPDLLHHNNTALKQRFIPEMIGSQIGSVLTADEVSHIHEVLPSRHQHRKWKLLYSSREHGRSLSTLFSRVEDQGASVLVLKTCAGNIMGAYLSESIRPFNRFYGTGETFVYSFCRENNGTKDHVFHRYAWTRHNHMIVYTDTKCIIVGSGGAIRVEKDLLTCSSNPCSTFG